MEYLCKSVRPQGKSGPLIYKHIYAIQIIRWPIRPYIFLDQMILAIWPDHTPHTPQPWSTRYSIQLADLSSLFGLVNCRWHFTFLFSCSIISFCIALEQLLFFAALLWKTLLWYSCGEGTGESFEKSKKNVLMDFKIEMNISILPGMTSTLSKKKMKRRICQK